MTSGSTGQSVTVEVPASTANLGAGFDALALALDLVDVITVTPAHDLPPGEVFTDVLGEGAAELSGGRPNRFTEALIRSAGEAGHGWHVEMRNAIPLARGLGSSAAATVAGLLAGRAVRGAEVSDEDLLGEATNAEGHPENAAASILGGFVVAVASRDRPAVVRFDPPPGLLAVLFVPDRQLSTEQMRSVLPDMVARADAVHNVGRAALAVAAFATGRLELLGPATDDRLHEPYRARVFPALPVIASAAREAGALGGCLSGAGSSIIAFCRDHAAARPVGIAMRQAAEQVGEPGELRIVAARSEGATVVSR